MEDLKDLLTSSRSKQKVRTTVKHVEVEDENGWSINQYKVLECIGHGTSGQVFKATRLIDGKVHLFAIKKMRRKVVRKFGAKRQAPTQNLAPKQVAIMKKLNHPNLLKLYQVILHPGEDVIFLVMELCENGQIIEWDALTCRFVNLRPCPPLRRLFRDCIKALSYCFCQGIFHRDIKPQNIIFDQNSTAKFADFGVSILAEKNTADDDLVSDIQGTQAFYPPQFIIALQGDAPWRFRARAVDIWALGITFYAYSFGTHPFLGPGDDKQSMFYNIVNHQLTFPDEEQIEGGLKLLLSRMLNKKPSERITVQQLINNGWINEGEEHLVREIKNQIIKVKDEDVKQSFSVYTLQLAHKFIRNMKGKLSKEPAFFNTDKGKEVASENALTKSQSADAFSIQDKKDIPFQLPTRDIDSGKSHQKFKFNFDAENVLQQLTRKVTQQPYMEMPIRKRMISEYKNFRVSFFNRAAPVKQLLGSLSLQVKKDTKEVLVYHRPDVFNSVKLQLDSCSIFVRKQVLAEHGPDILQTLQAKASIVNDKLHLQDLQYFTVE